MEKIEYYISVLVQECVGLSSRLTRFDEYPFVFSSSCSDALLVAEYKGVSVDSLLLSVMLCYYCCAVMSYLRVFVSNFFL